MEGGRELGQWEGGRSLTLQVLILSKAGVVHQVLLGFGPGGLEADAAHAVQDALQRLDVPLAQLLGMLLGGWQGTGLGLTPSQQRRTPGLLSPSSGKGMEGLAGSRRREGCLDPILREDVAHSPALAHALTHLLFLGQEKEDVVVDLFAVPLWHYGPHFQLPKHLLSFPWENREGQKASKPSVDAPRYKRAERKNWAGAQGLNLRRMCVCR